MGQIWVKLTELDTGVSRQAVADAFGRYGPVKVLSLSGLRCAPLHAGQGPHLRCTRQAPWDMSLSLLARHLTLVAALLVVSLPSLKVAGAWQWLAEARARGGCCLRVSGGS